MLFNSYVFLLVFLPIVWAVYFGLNKCKWFGAAKFALTVASFVFYGYRNWRLCLLLLASIGINYLLHLALMGQRPGERLRKALMITGIALNLLILFYFKYLDFAIGNLNFLTGSKLALYHIALPLGISFYTFQQLSFVVDSYHRQMEKYGFLDYALFVSFFPQLVAGPIVLHSEMIPQFRDKARKKPSYEYLMAGLEYLILGLAKKVLLADSFGRMTDAGFESIRSLNSLSAVAVMLAYTMEIYFDFSGYCDMAMGIGKLFGMDIPINFDSPYKARNISVFWEKWHITLTRFLTTYLYIPFGGNRKGTFRTCLNVLLVFTLSGLWHGAAWTYVVWGMLHGLMMVLYRLFRKRTDALPGWFTWLLTFGFVNIAWLFFAAVDMLQPFKLMYMMVFGGLGGFTEGIVSAVCEKNLLTTLLGAFLGDNPMTLMGQVITAGWLVGGLLLCIKGPSSHEMIAAKCRKQWYLLWLALVFVWSVTKLSLVSKFIYFNF